MAATSATDPFLRDLPPPPLQQTWNGRRPGDSVASRGADLPGVVALPVRALMPGLPDPIWAVDPAFGPTDLEVVRERARVACASVDWSKLERGRPVNLIANPHGFQIMGEGYVAMLEELARHVVDTTGARVRLRIAESMGHIENPDWMRIYDLRSRFGDAEECPQIGQGTRIDTRLGDMYVTKKLFDAPYFIHTHVTEMREGYLHRMLDRLLKPFGMAYARLETRSAYHFGFGPRTGQMVARSIFDSAFIQQRYTGTVVLDTTSEGVVDVHGRNDLDALDRELAVNIFRNYGGLIRLLAEIDDCIAVFDGHGCSLYTYSGGIAFDNLLCADTDFLDLDNLALLSVGMESRGNLTMGSNAAIKAIVINYMAGGVPSHFVFNHYPVHVAGAETYQWLLNDPSNSNLEGVSTPHPDLTTAIRSACEAHGSENLIIFDQTPGAFRVSEGLGRHLLERAPRVAAALESEYLPKWLSQRNLV
jgi:hypothetical protein